MLRVALVFLLVSMSAQAADAPQTIRFKGGLQIGYVVSNAPIGTSLAQPYILTFKDGGRVPVRSVNLETLKPETDSSGELYCFDIGYDDKTDLLTCNARGAAGQSWHVDYYAATADGLELERSFQIFSDDPDTSDNEEKTITLYQRKD